MGWLMVFGCGLTLQHLEKEGWFDSVRWLFGAPTQAPEQTNWVRVACGEVLQHELFPVRWSRKRGELEGSACESFLRCWRVRRLRKTYDFQSRGYGDVQLKAGRDAVSGATRWAAGTSLRSGSIRMGDLHYPQAGMRIKRCPDDPPLFAAQFAPPPTCHALRQKLFRTWMKTR